MKNISGTYLIYRLFARGRATSKHGGGGWYGAILEFKGEQLKKFKGEKNKKSKRRCESLVTECMTRKK
jgi:PHP family Zn ribbon phosphoesterase